MANLESYVTGNGDNQRTLVVVFLRGGADGLNLVAPLIDDGYYKARPRIAISKSKAVALDGSFGLNPLLSGLQPAFKDGKLAIIHAVGSEDTTRSHFEAQDLMEHGGIVGGGWLGRFLRAQTTEMSGPLSAVALGKSVPECLRGAPSATVFQSMDEFSLGENRTKLANSLAQLYGMQPDSLGKAGRYTLDAINRIEKLRKAAYLPAHGAEYGTDAFSSGLKQVARLIKARVGLQAASVDLNGWDSHFGQATVMDPLITRLSTGLGAFYKDLGSGIDQTTVVVMTEFGRRVEENSAFGTDHGRASVMFVMGGGISGGKIHGKWPGLTKEVLEGPGDLPVMTNYRNVLAPILQKHGAGQTLEQIFPEFKLDPLALYS
ncbi:MAG: hypothetical protein JWN25_3060 [Verrucomicrobiales bacterium]|nr:hypothetical protein [Verrucomicrobiales bacterium]MDB6129529.1 hypothetical protein [Verrucomicrobiales bacterium]